MAFLKPNNSNLASFYNVWLGKISFGLKLFSGFFWLFFSKNEKKLVFLANLVSHVLNLLKLPCGLRYRPQSSENYPNLVG